MSPSRCMKPTAGRGKAQEHGTAYVHRRRHGSGRGGSDRLQGDRRQRARLHLGHRERRRHRSEQPFHHHQRLRPANWTALARDLDGTLVRPGDASWATAHQLYNTRFDGLKPAAVAYVAHADDVRTALAYARAHRTKVAIRNGGHSYGGWSSGDGRLIIDVSKLNRVRASGTTAVVGAGSKLIDVYRALAAKGVTIPAGSCPTVGVSGLVLGGGHGVVSRAYGLTCDSLTQATIITADGRELTANATTNKDLFWALRGAGNGNFGVVTELQFKTHPAPQAVTGYLTWPGRRRPR